MCPRQQLNQEHHGGEKACPLTNPPEFSARRNFVQWCIGGMAALSAAIVAWPVFTFIRLPKRIGESRPIEVPLESLQEDQAIYFNRQGSQIALIFTDKKPKLFDASCTHLGCLVAWNQNDHLFHCPCHGAIFNDQGAPVSGPVSQPLKQIAFEIKDNTLIIT